MKTCFVISPIGKPDSPTRKRSDQVLKYIIEPAAKKMDYGIVRADKITEPGIITSQIIEHLMDDDLVVADLTDHNPNVFYELAVRHAVRKPVIQMIEGSQPLPFDVYGMRTIQIDNHDWDSITKCVDELCDQIKSLEKDGASPSPISRSIDFQGSRKSGQPDDLLMEILNRLQVLSPRVEAIYRQTRPVSIPVPTVTSGPPRLPSSISSELSADPRFWGTQTEGPTHRG